MASDVVITGTQTRRNIGVSFKVYLPTSAASLAATTTLAAFLQDSTSGGFVQAFKAQATTDGTTTAIAFTASVTSVLVTSTPTVAVPTAAPTVASSPPPAAVGDSGSKAADDSTFVFLLAGLIASCGCGLGLGLGVGLLRGGGAPPAEAASIGLDGIIMGLPEEAEKVSTEAEKVAESHSASVDCSRDTGYSSSPGVEPGSPYSPLPSQDEAAAPTEVEMVCIGIEEDPGAGVPELPEAAARSPSRAGKVYGMARQVSARAREEPPHQTAAPAILASSSPPAITRKRDMDEDEKALVELFAGTVNPNPAATVAHC